MFTHSLFTLFSFVRAILTLTVNPICSSSMKLPDLNSSYAFFWQIMYIHFLSFVKDILLKKWLSTLAHFGFKNDLLYNDSEPSLYTCTYHTCWYWCSLLCRRKSENQEETILSHVVITWPLKNSLFFHTLCIYFIYIYIYKYFFKYLMD